MLGLINNNGSRIWRWKKADILFLVGIGLVIYGAAVRDVALIMAGLGVVGVPIFQRGDKG